jgi:hypothetical protein
MSSFNRYATGIAVAALLALPASGLAQTPPSQPPATQPPATAEPQPPAAQAQKTDQSSTANAEAKEHLAQAKTALEGVQVETLSARAKSQVADLKKRLNTLERSVSANDNASAKGAANRNASATSGSRGNSNWATEVAAIDKTLTALLGPDATTGAGAPATSATSGTTGTSKAKADTLDEATRAKLLEFRKHITAFATVISGGKTTPEPSAQPTMEPSATNPSATSPTNPSMTTPPATNPPATTPPATAPPASTPQPTGTTGTSSAQDPATQTAQPDEQLARKQLTEARNTLSELTQLPAASQLAGEARTQVSQLISNFNELITTQAEWRASYAKVNANLTALVGPDPGAADPSATAGAVGTSGSAGANLDPTIREKLMTLRRQLSEFEKAAGGTAATQTSANPRPEDPPAATTPPATTTPPTTTPPSTTPPATTPPSTTPPTTEPQAAGSTDVMRHIAAIEAMLKSEDDSGGLTLTKAQLEQLRTHLAALRQSLEKK